jgi:hypothetical protein
MRELMLFYAQFFRLRVAFALHVCYTLLVALR